MKRFGKRKPALLLAVSMLLGLLAGCGKKDDSQQLSASVYVPKYLDVALDVDNIGGGCCDGENLYIIGQKQNEVEGVDPGTGEKYTTFTYIYDIYRISLADGSAERLPNYVGPSVPEGRNGSASIDEITAAGDGTFWVREYVYLWDETDMKYPTAVDDVARAEVAVEDDAAEEEADGEETEDAETEAASTPASTEADVPADMPAIDPGYVGESQETIIRRHLDAQGGELERIDISNLNQALADVLEEDTYINGTSFGADGSIYAVTDSKLYVLDPQLNVRFTLEGKDMWGELIALNDGTMGMRKWDYDEATETSTNKLLTIDPEKQDWGPEYILPDNAYSFYPGGGEYLCYYQLNDAVFGWKGAGSAGENGSETAMEGERLFSWIEADINSGNVRNFFFLPDGRVAAVTQEWSEDGKGKAIVSVIVMTSTPRSELPEKTTLVYATMYLTYDAREKIIDFNKKSETHRIEVRDYSEYVTSDNDDSAALQKLNTEILAGSVPDILDTRELPLRQYGARGVLEDLWPFIDNDPDLGRDALMVRPLEANCQDGKLYEIFNSFSIRTTAGSGRIVGDRTGWTLADLQEALSKMPEGCSIFGQSDTRDDMLSTVVALNMDRFVDWDTGKCSFDSQDFKDLLSFCGSFPAEFSWENVDWETWEEEDIRAMNGKQLLLEMYLSGFDWDIQRLAAIFNDDFSFIGYPREDGGCGSSFSTGRGVAMSASCKDKDGAWSFIRQVLLPQVKDDEEYYGQFPINKSDFDKMVDQALKPRYEEDENGDPLLGDDGQPIPIDPGAIWISDGTEIPARAINQADVDKVMALYNAVDTVYRYDEKIFSAVQEVAGQYFAGDKPLDEAASLIQNKVSLYVNESK